MSDTSQFWWNWWVSLAVAIATFLVVFVALCGDWIKAHLFPPKLALCLRNAMGVKTVVIRQWSTEQGQKQMKEDARYYHVEVSNRCRWPRATQVQVYLLQIEELGPTGDMQTIWVGALPVVWTHQAAFPLARTIGPVANCDLCSVVKNRGIQLHPLIVPNNFPTERKGPTVLIVSMQARGVENESPIARFQIAWDGKWEDGDMEMARHLVVKDVTETV